MKRSKTSGSDGFASAFGEALNKQLAARQMRQGELATKLGVHKSYVSRVASGVTNASPSVVNQFASAMNLDPAATASLMSAAAAAKGYTVPETPCPHCGKKPSDPKAG